MKGLKHIKGFHGTSIERLGVFSLSTAFFGQLLLLGLFTFCLVPSSAFAQQLPLFSQYRQAGFVLNPALTGVDDRTEAFATMRRQWTRLPGAPETAVAGFRHFFEDENMGIGGYFIFDRTGPTSAIGVNGTYSYHISFDRWEERRLSFGLTASMYQYRLKGSELTLDEPDDLAIYKNNVSRILPDAGLGIAWVTPDYQVGFSIPQAISLNAQFEGDDGLSQIRRIAHFYLMAGYKYRFGYDDEHLLEPALWAKYAPHSPVNVDFNARVTIDNLVIVGLGFSTSRRLLGEFGLKIGQGLQVGYGVSFHFTNYHSYLGFNHEFMLTYTFDAPEHYISF